MRETTTKWFARLLLLGFLLLMAMMFTGCKSVKKTQDKKKESVSLVEKKDVQFDQKIEANLDIIHLDKSKSYSYVPVDPERPSMVVDGKDTLNFINTRIEVNHKDVTTTTKENSVVSTHESDRSETKIDKKTKEVKKYKESTGTSPALIWGLLLLLLIIIAVWYFRKYIPFL